MVEVLNLQTQDDPTVAEHACESTVMSGVF